MMKLLGVKKIIITNISGALNPEYKVHGIQCSVPVDIFITVHIFRLETSSCSGITSTSRDWRGGPPWRGRMTPGRGCTV